MKASRICWIGALLLLRAVAGAGQDASRPVDLHAEIQAVYNFQPHTLTSAQITAKSAVLDQFWNNAKSQRDVYVPALRKELADFRNPPYFLFDGSELLRSLSREPADRKIILAAMREFYCKDNLIGRDSVHISDVSGNRLGTTPD
jgi:hypothetical protein